MSDARKIREEVSTAYAKAVTRGSSCCDSGVTAETVSDQVDAGAQADDSRTPRRTKGVAASFAGYTEEELAELPEGAVENSFGCGNPLAFSEVREGDTVVDLGSGAGIDLLIAARAVGPEGRVIGVDMTDEMITKARAHVAEAGVTNVEVRKGLIEELPIESGTADWVISNCVINLSPEKEHVFAEIARVLKPGGRMQVSDIVVEGLPDWMRESAGLYSACIGGAVSEKEYLAGLSSAGLVEVEVKDRLVYEASQIAGIVESELPDALEKLTKDGVPLGREQLRTLAGSVEGKVMSLKIAARKA
ncbi:MAG: methyltransferase type 11 [Gemmatimonadetes bacterium]|nr:methyltransferase type 11 [Gemmatimonadota bacterium]